MIYKEIIVHDFLHKFVLQGVVICAIYLPKLYYKTNKYG